MRVSILLSVLLLTSCETVKKTVRQSYQYEMYIDYKYISFQGQNSTQRVYMEIDSTDGIWYDGKVIINEKDTVRIHGFEKGSHYVTTYRIAGSLKNGHFAIWCRGMFGKIRDSLTIEDRDKENGILKEKTVLYRQARRVCY